MLKRQYKTFIIITVKYETFRNINVTDFMQALENVLTEHYRPLGSNH